MRVTKALKILFSNESAESSDKSELKIQDNAAQILGIFQRDGRLIDFLMEDISQFSDEQVGAAVRDVHKGCANALKEYFSIVPVIDKPENSEIPTEAVNAKEVKIIGNAATKTSKTGILRHQGWKLAENKLPQLNPDKTSDIIKQAEIEIE